MARVHSKSLLHINMLEMYIFLLLFGIYCFYYCVVIVTEKLLCLCLRGIMQKSFGVVCRMDYLVFCQYRTWSISVIINTGCYCGESFSDHKNYYICSSDDPDTIMSFIFNEYSIFYTVLTRIKYCLHLDLFNKY